MMRHLTTFTVTIVLFLTSCELENNSTNHKRKSNTIQSYPSIYAILPFDSSLIWDSQPANPRSLTQEDILKIDTLLNECIEEYNLEQERQFREINESHPEHKVEKINFVINLKRYKRQYMGFINSKGQKEVWINCFCGEWDKYSLISPVIVRDGGNCYFNLKVNLTTGKYYDLNVNGEA